MHTVRDAAETIRLLQQSGLLLAQEEQSGQACLITGDTPDLIDLETWVLRNRPKEPGELSQMFRVPPQAATGEFTRVFRTLSERGAEAPAPGANPAASEAAPMETERLDVTQTISFAASSVAPPFPASKPEPVPPPSSVPSPPPAADKPMPGEFTQMFRPAAPSSDAEAKAPGEFTGLFRAAGPDAPLPPVAPERKQHVEPEPGPPPSKQPAASQAGEFTSLFRPAVLMPEAPPSKAPATDRPGEFTSLFRPAVPMPEPEPPTPASDERTRLFHVPPTPPQAEASFAHEFYPPSEQPSMPSPTPESRDFDNFYDSPYESNQAVMDPKLHGRVAAPPPGPTPPSRDDFTGLYGASGGLPDSEHGQSVNPDATRFFHPPPPQSRPDSRPAARDDEQWDALFRPRTAPANPKPEETAQAKPEPASPNGPQNKTLLILSVGLGVLLLLAIVVIVILLRRH